MEGNVNLKTANNIDLQPFTAKTEKALCSLKQRMKLAPLEIIGH